MNSYLKINNPRLLQKTRGAVPLSDLIFSINANFSANFAEIWPEFGAEGKEKAKVEDLMRNDF
jgi:hypothetical protein